LEPTLDQIVDINNLPPWARKLYKEAWDEAKKRANLSKLVEYRNDPVKFGNEVLGHHYYSDVEELMRSIVTNPITIAKSSTGVGKSMPVDTRIPSPVGWKRMGDLVVGDEIFTISGETTKIIGVYPQGEQPTYRITFNDQTSILASEDHLWVAEDAGQKSMRLGRSIYTTLDLYNLVHRRMTIPLCYPVEYPEKEFFIHPYILGVMLGDGCTRGGACRFTAEEEEIPNRVCDLLPVGFELHEYNTANRQPDYSIVRKPGNINPFITELKKLDLMGKKSHDKFVPKQYLYSAIEQRKELLRGLLDTDGYIDKKGNMQYSTVSPRLASDVRELVWSLGGTATVHTKIPKYTYDGEKRTGQMSYNIGIKLSFCPVTIKRKSNRHINSNDRRVTVDRAVRSVEYVGMMESVCIRVDDPSHLFLAENFIVTHNTFAAADVALWWFSVHDDAQVFVTAAPPLENLKSILWGEMLRTVRLRPDLFSKFAIKELEIKRHDKSAIHGVTIPMTGTSEERVAKFSGRHAPHLLFIVDEGDAVPPEVYEGIEGCSSGGMARLLIMFNPKAQMGPVFQMEIDQRAHIVNLSALRHPNVITGKDIIPGAVTQETVVRRINQWTRPIVEGESPTPSRKFEVPEFLVGAVANSLQGIPYPPLRAGTRFIMESAFSYMVLGQYPEQGENQLISQSWVLAARERWDKYVSIHGEKPPDIRPRLGLDVAEFGQDFNAPILRYGNFVPRIERIWQGVDPTVTGEKAAEICRTHKVDIILVDGTGYGSSVAPQISKLVKGLRCVSVKVAGKPSPMITTELGEFFQIRDQMWWACREWLREEEAMLPPEPMLLEELMTPTYRVNDRGRIQVSNKDDLRAKLKRSSNYADALVLTFFPADRAKIMRLGE
jgi:hypothetical protein